MTDGGKTDESAPGGNDGGPVGEDELHGLLVAEVEHEGALQIRGQGRIVLVDDHEHLCVLDAFK